jgi:FkbM family methyltransferase
MFTTDEDEYIKFILEKKEKLDINNKTLYKFNIEGYSYYTYMHLNNFIINTLNSYKKLLTDYNVIINENDIVIDIGAHHGMMSIYFASCKAEVYSYEPNPINYEILKKNLEANPTLKLNIYNNAISNINKTLELCYGHTSTTSSLKHLEFEEYTLDKSMTNSIEVNCLSLKDIIIRFPKIKVLKIDCEYESFLSLNKDLMYNIQYILLEAHTTKEYKIKDMEDILDKFGFEFITYSSGDKYKEYICKNKFWK